MSTNRVEKLVYRYLRFNGYLTVENFTVHPDFKKHPETEADILAVRFPRSEENPEGYTFRRDKKLIFPDVNDFIIGEVKSGQCGVNENSWGLQKESISNTHLNGWACCKMRILKKSRKNYIRRDHGAGMDFTSDLCVLRLMKMKNSINNIH